jgi:hypothetical protein
MGIVVITYEEPKAQKGSMKFLVIQQLMAGLNDFQFWSQVAYLSHSVLLILEKK